MTPQEFRNELKKNKVKQWQIAKQAKVSEYTLIRWLRDDELTKERENTLTNALKELIRVK